MITINNLSFRYGRRRPLVLEDFEAEIREGGVYGLLGPNGAGKSTLLYLMTGALTPQTGEVLLDGDPARRRNPSTLAGIFLVPEEIQLPHMTLRKFVSVYSAFYPDFDNSVMNHALEVFGFSPTGRIDNLSMGQKKKIFISFALACRTKVLLMDEPTNGLDIPGKAAFRRLVAETMTDDRIFIISTHQVRDLDRILDNVLIMNSRRILLDCSIADIQSRVKFLHDLPACPPDVLYSLPSVGGFDVMTPNNDDAETDVNLEILFDFAMSNPERLKTIFNEKTSRND